MGESVRVKVNCYHSGQFTSENDELSYANGKVEVLEVDSIMIIEDVTLKMIAKIYVGNMWYKMPYEDVKDRKPLWENVDENKRKMTAAGRWSREIDIFVEKADSIMTNNEDEEDSEDASYDPNGEEEEESASDDYDDDDDFQDTDDDDDFQDTDDDDDHVAEEDLAVFNSKNYDDEILDEDEVYPDTEVSSDEEEEQAERMARDGLLDGVFSLRQLYSSGKEFKKNTIAYILKTRRNVVYNRWEKTKIGAICNGKECQWRIYCSVEKPIKKWMVKVYKNRHTCYPTGKCKMIRSLVIADIILEDVRRDPEMSAPNIKHEMKKRYNIIISPNQSRTARRKAFDKLQDECNEQFARLRDYELQLLKKNPHGIPRAPCYSGRSMVEINTIMKANGAEAFSSFYVCFDALRIAWKHNCRPIIGLDGTFLKNSMQGMLLTAIGRDPNNQIYPIAWGVVSVENKPNWQWFIHKLKINLQLGDGDDVTIISDMHKGLIHGVSVELPNAEHRACARHIYSNLKKNHKSDMLKPMFWRVASNYNQSDFERNLAAFREFDAKACDDLMKKDHRTWCRAFFRTNPSCADTHNNLTESFNRTLKIARKKPFVDMLELIRRDAMHRIVIRLKTASKEIAKFTPKTRKEVAKSCEQAQNCYSIPSTGGEFEVVEFGNGYEVNLSMRTCVCRKWDLTGISCGHAICAIREHDLEVNDYISNYYLTSKWQDLYTNGLRPSGGPRFWPVSGGPRIEAPPYKRPPGRPKGKARIKGVNESPKKGTTKVSREGRITHCGVCGNEGDNSRRCPSESDADRAKRKRLNEEARLAQVEGVSSTAP